jgi:hypothetical protein
VLGVQRREVPLAQYRRERGHVVTECLLERTHALTELGSELPRRGRDRTVLERADERERHGLGSRGPLGVGTRPVVGHAELRQPRRELVSERERPRAGLAARLGQLDLGEQRRRIVDDVRPRGCVRRIGPEPVRIEPAHE